MGDPSKAGEIRYDLARNRARGLLTLTKQRPPVDVQAIIDLAGIPVVERAVPDGTRATIGDVAGRRSIILNRKWKFSSENERRWVLAEELGHVLMGHRLVESTEPGKPAIGLLEPRRHFYEREARAFASELLMPFAEVRRRWFGLSRRERRGHGAPARGRVRRDHERDASPTSADEGYPGVKLTPVPPTQPTCCRRPRALPPGRASIMLLGSPEIRGEASAATVRLPVGLRICSLAAPTA